MKFELNVTKKEFENNKGEIVTYFEYVFDLDGTKVRVKPVEEDKKLCTYLLREKGGGVN